ncbi:MAG: ketopantoate reductase family protein [Anaerolineales bacterium]
MSEQKILIIGSGAMACLVAARLSKAGKNIIMLGHWAEALQTIRRDGITLHYNGKNFQTPPLEITDQPDQIGQIEHAIVLVKSWQTEKAAQQLRQCLRKNGIALTLQNGMGNREMLAQYLGANRVALGIATMGAFLQAPGKVQYGGEGKISLSIHDRLGFLKEALLQSGFEVEEVVDPDSLLWGKLVVNSAINPLTALLDVPNGALLERPTARAMMINLARETAAVAHSLRIPLPFDNPAAHVEEVAARTANNYSSMLQDVRRCAPTEIDAISGAIVHAGEQADVPTPLNEIMWQLVKAKVYSRTSPQPRG